MTKSFCTRLILVFPVLFFVQGNLKAQYVEQKELESTTSKEDFITVNVGLSSPTGDYGDQDLSNYYAGLAKTGYNISLTYALHLWQATGVMLMGNYASHEFNTGSISSELDNSLPFASHLVRSGRYSTSAVLGGLFYTIKMKNGSLDFRFMLGYGMSVIPELFVQVQDSVSTYSVTQKRAVSASMSTNFGIGLRKDIAQNLAFSVYFDFYSTSPDFSLNTEDSQGATSVIDYSQPMGMLNTSIGIVYRMPHF